ncbi:MAG: hypothetical protein LBB80_03270 [Treponema sp.]|jgi:hypothetical protein|nr:hypothetical protein [Treponema sp.]
MSDFKTASIVFFEYIPYIFSYISLAMRGLHREPLRLAIFYTMSQFQNSVSVDLWSDETNSQKAPDGPLLPLILNFKEAISKRHIAIASYTFSLYIIKDGYGLFIPYLSEQDLILV